MEFDKKAWQGAASTSLSDAMKGLQTMRGEIKPLTRSMKAIGPAYTVQVVRNDCAVIFRALRDARPGEVLVVATQGTKDAAFLGDIVTAIAAKRGLGGIVIDGCVRDSEAISKGDFPVFACGAVPKIPAVNYLGQVQERVECGGVIVSPGDIVYGDADGVVVVPQQKAAEVLEKALEKEAKDQWKKTSLIPDDAALEAFLTKACGDT